MSYHDIVVELDGHVETITINRPQAKNSLTYRTYDEMEAAVRESTARCLVITGAEGAFCAGDDVKQVMANPDAKPGESLARNPRTTPLADALLHTDIPVIAAVNGAAVGWGMELALMADIRVASDRAKFGELFVLRGLNCDVPGIGRLADAVGRERAAELLFTGEVIDAPTAHAIGLVSRVVPHDQLLGDRFGVGPTNRRQPTTCRSGNQTGHARSAGSRLGRTRRMGVTEPGPAVSDQ